MPEAICVTPCGGKIEIMMRSDTAKELCALALTMGRRAHINLPRAMVPNDEGLGGHHR